MIVEIAVFNPESAVIAFEAGAHRIELCSAAALGGLTPSVGTMQRIRNLISIPIFTMIRPREGDFCYSDLEFETMLYDIEAAKSVGMNGIVSGILNPNGTIDEVRTNLLVEAAYPLPLTFHRAFDMSKDLHHSLEAIIKCGCSRILTSGGKNKAPDAIDTLTSLIKQANNRIAIMPGSGIQLDHIETFKKLGFVEIHLSARTLTESRMQFRKEEPTMGGKCDIPDYSIIIPDKQMIGEIINKA